MKEMFEYDSCNDQYNEVVLRDGENDAWERKSSISTSSIRGLSNSRCSTKSSVNVPYFLRIVTKTGRLNVFQVKIPKKYAIYLRDLGNTLLNIQWRWIMVTLCLVNFVSFFVFGTLFMFIADISGDFEENAQNLCVVNTRNLTGYILLSIETMLTIGYGYRYPTENCVLGWTVPWLQALVSIGIQGALVSAVYVKITKPFTKNTLGLFSQKAVVCLRDEKLCLIIRLADVKGKISVGTNISMYFISKENLVSESISWNLRQIKIQPHGFLIFPTEILHVIDSESPFWTLGAYELLTKPFELIVVAEGQSAVTGQSSQNKTSYTNSDIFWGHRFASCVNFDENNSNFVINYKDIDKVIPFDTPLCSAKELDVIRTNECNV